MTPAPSGPARVLVTGFEPFGGSSTNPSELVARRLGELGVGGASVTVEVLPVDFAAATTRIAELVAATGPDLVLALGLAGDRTRVSVERVALNLEDARIPDNGGAQPRDVPVLAGGPAALFATVPVRMMVAAIRRAGVDAEMSLSAGSFVCNAVLYTALTAAGAATTCGFIHLPPAAVLPVDVAVDAVRAAIGAALPTEEG